MLNTLDASEQDRSSASRHKAYNSARFHSKRVRRLKVLLPVAAVIISAVFIAVSIARSYLPENISIEGAQIEDGKVVMSHPAIAGRNAKGINYSLMAEKALQDIKNPDLITLKNIKASMPVNEDTIAHVEALSGDFNRTADTLKMTEPFTIVMDNGMKAQFQTADLDIKSGNLISNTTVSIQKGGASVVAQSVKMTDKGSVIEFDGQVRMHIEPATLHNSGT
jgi:lipopolysaccharide export system protein LptC